MSWVLFPNTGTPWVSTPDSAALSLTGDLDVRMSLVMDDWTPGAPQVLIAQYSVAGGQRSWQLSVNTAGTLNLLWTVNGSTNISKDSTAATGRGDGLHLWIRVVHDVDNGAAGNDVLFYTSTDPITTAAASVTWGQLGTTVTTASTTSHFNSNIPIGIGAVSAVSANRLVGKVYYAELRDASATIQGSPDFRDATQITTPDTVFTDPQTNAWTLQTPAAWVDDTPASGAGSLLLLGVG